MALFQLKPMLEAIDVSVSARVDKEKIKGLN